MKSDEEEAGEAPSIPSLSVSYKPQTISPKFQGSVEDLFNTKIRTSFNHPQFQTDVVKPMAIDGIMDQPLSVLSGGELQRVALVLALGKPANIYLIDEPSAYLDSEQRIVCARVEEGRECDVDHQALYPACQANCVHRGARLHHGGIEWRE